MEVGCSYWRTGAALPSRHPPLTARALPQRHRTFLQPRALTARKLSSPTRSHRVCTRAGSLKQEAQRSNEEVYDRLVDLFTERRPEDWRKLIAYSRQWPILAPGVFARFEERAASEEDEEKQRAMRRTLRRLRSVWEELSEYAGMMDAFREAASRDWESMVTVNRPTLTSEFFAYLDLRVRAAAAAAAAAGQEESREGEALAALAAHLAVLVEAHDRVAQDEAALEAAGESFASLLDVDSMDAAEARIDQLAAEGKLDPALLLTMARAYAGVKETDKTKEEVKDIMAHLYFKAKETFAAQQPPEARILKFLLSVDSPREREALLDQAFQSGPELSTSAEDYLHTTPETLLNSVDNVLGMYDGSIGASGGTMASQAATLMNPEVIARLRELQQVIRKRYM